MNVTYFIFTKNITAFKTNPIGFLRRTNFRHFEDLIISSYKRKFIFLLIFYFFMRSLSFFPFPFLSFASTTSLLLKDPSFNRVKVSSAGLLYPKVSSRLPLSSFLLLHRSSFSPSSKLHSRHFSSLISLPKTSSLLIPSPHIYFIFKRFMLSSAYSKTKHCLLVHSKKIWLTQQRFAVRRANNPDSHPKDPQALKNNPLVWDHVNKRYIRHIEFSRLKCGDSDCLPKDCQKLCGPCTGIETVGSATHGNPQTKKDEIHALDNNEDIQGNMRPQNIVMFEQPHQTGLASVHQKGTDYITKGPKATERRKIIIDNEKDHD